MFRRLKCIYLICLKSRILSFSVVCLAKNIVGICTIKASSHSRFCDRICPADRCVSVRVCLHNSQEDTHRMCSWNKLIHQCGMPIRERTILQPRPNKTRWDISNSDHNDTLQPSLWLRVVIRYLSIYNFFKFKNCRKILNSMRNAYLKRISVGVVKQYAMKHIIGTVYTLDRPFMPQHKNFSEALPWNSCTTLENPMVEHFPWPNCETMALYRFLHVFFV